MRKLDVAPGIQWVEIPQAGLYILCGCPADSVKHLTKRGLIINQEKKRVKFETGPNAILLSDVPLQKGRFANLAEFPVLQMLYKQGMILPGHPNNTGVKPLLIGLEEQIKAQVEYIYRGNYGLDSIEEILAAGIPEAEARDMMRLKLRFAFNKIMRTDELIETRIVRREPVEIRNGVFIRRKGLNEYEFTYDGDSVDIDLNLGDNEEFESSYELGFHDIKREYFSIVHSGEGDGWDARRPCMGSIVIFQGKIYLVDAGPNIMHSLISLGISVYEIEGIFHTHAHDDHFAGLTVLLRSARKIKYFATRLVRMSVFKKLSALLSLKETEFERYFEIHELKFDQWNNVEGLEVKPVLSPHPVETSILFFRTLWEGGHKTYAHLSDIASFDVLQGMVTDNPDENGISQEYFEYVKRVYRTRVNVKKIDCGEGLIHGKPEDFIDDPSEKIIMSHSALPFTSKQKEIGATASFGVNEVLIPTDQDYTKPLALQHLLSYFPDIPHHEIRMLLNCPVVKFHPGSLMVRSGRKNRFVYFILSGLLDLIISDLNIQHRISAGSLIGELSAALRLDPPGTYRAASNVSALRIPADLYIKFLKRNSLFDDLKKNIDHRVFLQRTWLFGELIPCSLNSWIAQHIRVLEVDTGQPVKTDTKPCLYLVAEGCVELAGDDCMIRKLSRGEFWGEEAVLFGGAMKSKAVAGADPVKILHIDADTIKDIPIVQWKLLETYEKRISCRQ